MARSSPETMEKVAVYCWNNQQKEVDGEEKNYFKAIAEDLNTTPRAVSRAVRDLERLAIVKTFSKGNKKCVRVRVDLTKGTLELD